MVKNSLQPPALALMLLAALALSSCGRTSSRTVTAPVTIVVHRGDGAIATTAKADWYAIGDDGKPVEHSAVAGAAGLIEAELPTDGEVSVRVVAPLHSLASVPVILNERNHARVDVTLVPIPLPASFDKVDIIGSFNGFDRSSAQPMERQGDGTFVWHGEAKKSPLAYQIVVPDKDGLILPGTQADRLEYEGWGCRSALDVEPGPVTIVFDPSKLQRVAGPAEPSVAWDEAHAYLNQVNAAETALAKAYGAVSAAKEGKEGAPAPSLEAPKSTLMELLSSADNGIARVWTASCLFMLPAPSPQGSALTEGELSEALAAAPPSSDLWRLRPSSLHGLMDATGKDGRPLLQAFTANPDPTVRGYAFAFLASHAKDSGDRDGWRSAYTELKTLAGKERVLGYYVKELDPDKAILPGKPVPAFEVTLLDGSTFSNAQLKGHYTLIDFWATWCGPCVGEMAELDKVYKEFSDDGFDILSLSFDKKRADIDEFREAKWPMPWKNAFVEGGFDSPLGKRFEVFGIPAPILVGPDGRIVAVAPETRGEKLEETLKAHLPASARSAERGEAS